MKNKFLCAAALVCVLTASGAYAQALEVLNPPTPTASKKKVKKSKANNGATAEFKPGSQETKKERSARLTRECKGQVNAGACSGYTR